ncbi:6-phosphofructokinase 1 [Sporomusaceae bacterium BoRhaA]|uniref:6-phosphofructokinase n=1 Tax=Pelorhabdus rhamnosifermentans TaxID=2772457 RepID=UPI001C060FC2|nr:ATP-dependent 6-phosphofructokinase [Pelorhabdus rhamnosifermentans]MBU2699460.1 6-phosphofructokinase 1 [Pelorhabdus rhamnosifermentans]
MKTIAVLTGGGDCPGLNAVIRAVYKTAHSAGIAVYGVKNGFKGLVEDDLSLLDSENVSGILPRGGTILGTTNRDNPFRYQCIEHGKIVYKDMSQQILFNLKQRDIEALIVIGGDGTLKIASEIADLGFPIVGVPKTIDNDLPKTERTFGFDTAVSIATEALDRLHTTAESHHRVMILEVMGRYAGWIALHSGIAGGADCILIPEISFKWDSIIDKIKLRQQKGTLFSVIVVAEGAKTINGELSVAKIVNNSPEKIRLGGIGNKIAHELENLLAVECRSTVLGHLQRGGSPTAFDRVLATRYGEAAVNAIINKKFKTMVALQNNEIVLVNLIDVVGAPYLVSVTHDLIKTGRSLGISFGD